MLYRRNVSRNEVNWLELKPLKAELVGVVVDVVDVVVVGAS